MTDQLETTTDVFRLIPGDAGAARAIADAHRSQAVEAAERAVASGRASAIEWEGAAATAFRTTAATHRRRCTHEETQFRRTSAALDAFVHALDHGRRRAASAVDTWLAAEAATDSARAAHDRLVRSAALPRLGTPTVTIVPAFIDPGERGRARAKADLADARAMVDRAEAAAVQALLASAESAPALPLLAAGGSPVAEESRAIRPVSTVMPFPGPASTAAQIAAWLSSGAYTFGQLVALCGSAAVIAAIPLVAVAGVGSGSTTRGTPAAARARRIALAEARIWAWTHYPDGTVRERAGVEAVDEPGFRHEEGPQSAEDVKEILRHGTRAGKNKPHREVDTPEDLEEVFEEITRGGTPAEIPNGYDGRDAVRLPDGTEIGFRNGSGSGGPTIDVKFPGSGKPTKVHLPKGWGK
jgi:hypothetical protein